MINYHSFVRRIIQSEAMQLLQKIGSTEKHATLQNMEKLLSHIKKDEESLSFGDIEIGKDKFYHSKSPFF